MICPIADEVLNFKPFNSAGAINYFWPVRPARETLKEPIKKVVTFGLFYVRNVRRVEVKEVGGHVDVFRIEC